MTVKNKIKMIITDLDNTLLDSECQISKYTKNVFKKCKERGIIIVFATARPYRITRMFFDSIKPDAVVCHCGGSVYVNDKMICHNGINSITAKDIINKIIYDFPKINIAIESGEEIYTNFDTSLYWKDLPYKNIDLENMPYNIIDKVIIGLELIENMDEVKKHLPDEVYIEKMYEKRGLIMNKNATKWNGIKEMLKYYGINKENTVSFGDDETDMEMIDKCGTGVAMENGLEKIKKAAKYICKNNNEDGVAKWIEENIKNKEKK